ncbi:hypothetical protein JZ751_008404 [Albula glossodonta]|uniref:Uncharacterized protein n=1 Tax=Albula glossodonta TaxID=121402 RepID=A0A8T2MNB1_9TELE|nr:hypothetical protein JZ751_008404 [Albula glossodonta]
MGNTLLLSLFSQWTLKHFCYLLNLHTLLNSKYFNPWCLSLVFSYFLLPFGDALSHISQIRSSP